MKQEEIKDRLFNLYYNECTNYDADPVREQVSVDLSGYVWGYIRYPVSIQVWDKVGRYVKNEIFDGTL